MLYWHYEIPFSRYSKWNLKTLAAGLSKWYILANVGQFKLPAAEKIILRLCVPLCVSTPVIKEQAWNHIISSALISLGASAHLKCWLMSNLAHDGIGFENVFEDETVWYANTGSSVLESCLPPKLSFGYSSSKNKEEKVKNKVNQSLLLLRYIWSHFVNYFSHLFLSSLDYPGRLVGCFISLRLITAQIIFRRTFVVLPL